jgi:hypothetical protein
LYENSGCVFFFKWSVSSFFSSCFFYSATAIETGIFDVPYGMPLRRITARKSILHCVEQTAADPAITEQPALPAEAFSQQSPRGHVHIVRLEQQSRDTGLRVSRVRARADE